MKKPKKYIFSHNEKKQAAQAKFQAKQQKMPADGGCSSNGKENYCRPGGKGPVIGKVIPKSRITEFYMKKQLAPVIPEKTESFQINNFRQKTENRRKQKKRNGTEFDIVFFHGFILRIVFLSMLLI